MRQQLRILSDLPPQVLLANLREAGRQLPAGDYTALLAHFGGSQLRVVCIPPRFRLWWRHAARTALRPICLGDVVAMSPGSRIEAIIRRRRGLMLGPAVWVIVWLGFWVWQRNPMFLWGAGLGLAALAGSAILTWGGFWSARQHAEARALEAILHIVATGKEPPPGGAT